MIIMGSWDLKAFEEMQGRKFDYGMMAFPIITKEINVNASGKRQMVSGKANEALAISKRANGEKLDAAVKVMQYLLSPEATTVLQNDLYMPSTLVGSKTSEKLSGFEMLADEDYNKANYTGPATIKEFSDFIVMSGQLYIAGKYDFDKYSSELNKEWKKGMDAAKKANNWTSENEYGIKK